MITHSGNSISSVPRSSNEWILSAWRQVLQRLTSGSQRLRSVDGPAQPVADWAAWLPGTCQVGRLVRRPGGPPRQIVEEGSGTEGGGVSGPLATDGGLSSDNLFAGAPEFLVTPLLMGLVCVISGDRFKEPVLPCAQLRSWRSARKHPQHTGRHFV